MIQYCTGGVRCERASAFLTTLLQERRTKQQQQEGQNTKNKKENLPQIYQLHGGIQRYLQSAQDTTTCRYYHGKNFVFDPRRYDPNCTKDIVGTCLVCGNPHDDYDNGCAPAHNREARCYKCRILILVCNTCRPTVTCWTPPTRNNNTNNNKDSEETKGSTTLPMEKPKLYCGGSSCLHMPPVRTLRPTTNTPSTPATTTTET